MPKRYVWDREAGAFVDPSTRTPMSIPDRAEVCMPAVRSDIEGYRSPIDGRWIGSNSSRRYDLESNNCVPAEPRKRPRGYANPEFCRKRGLRVSEEAQERLANERAKRVAPVETGA